MKKILSLFVIVALITTPSYAGFFSKKKKIIYKPVTNLTFDEAFAVAKCYLDKHKLLVHDFQYAKGVLTSSYLPFSDLLIEKRARIKFFYKDNLLNIELIDMQEKDNSGFWINNSTCLTHKPEKIKAAIAKELQEIANNPDTVNKCKERFFSDIDIHFIFLQHATEVAAKRWFEKYMKDREFSIPLSFEDLKENKSGNYKQYKYKLLGEYNPQGTMFSKETKTSSNRILVTLYTNSDKYVMASKGDKIQIFGKCKKVYFNKLWNAMIIVLVGE